MMHRLSVAPALGALVALAAIFAAGCDDDAAGKKDMGRDMMARPDMAPPAPDMDPPEPDMMIELDQAVPDMAEPDMAEPDMAEPDMAIPDMAIPDMEEVCNPSPETCNGRDDDCDENIDEGFGVDDVCSAGVGVCRVVARKVCLEDGTSGCPAEEGPADPMEACDGQDNDCDGTVDEDFDLDGDGAPACGFDACGDDCPLDDPELCRAVCDLDDCNDERNTTGPLIADECGDGIDQNCDGVDASCSVATGRLSALAIAQDDDPACLDGNGDGEADNALQLIGAIANDGLGNAVRGGQLNLFISAAGLAPPGDVGIFDLAVLTARRDGGGYVVDDAALDENGDPLIIFPRSRVRDGQLRTEPGVFSLDVPVVPGVELTLVLSQAEIRGAVAVDEGDGFSLAEGILWGSVTDDDLQAALDGLEQGCAEQDPPPEFCGPLLMLRPVLPNLLRLDQDLDGDGVSESYSACLRIEAAPAALGGWPPE